MKTGKRLISVLLLIAMTFTLIPGYAFAQERDAFYSVVNLPAPIQEQSAETKNGIPFTDVGKGDWYYNAIVYTYENNIFSGTGADSFSPKEGMTRAMFVTALGRFAGINQEDYSASSTGFSDVKAGAYYAPYVAWAVEKGIAYGIGEKLFDVNGFVTREQMAVFSERFFKAYDISYLSDTPSSKTPADLSTVSPWARASVLNLYQAGILQGDAKGNFNPKGRATRAETATTLMNIDAGLDCLGIASTNGENQENNQSGSGASKGSTASSYILRFNTDGGTPIAEKRVPKGQTAGSLPVAVKSNAIFAGWYTDPSFSTMFNENTPITQSLTLYARYMDYENSMIEAFSNVQIAAQGAVGTDHFIDIIAANPALTADQVRTMLEFVCTGGVDDRGISVTDTNGGFRVLMEGGFKPGADYKLTLPEGLSFAGKESTAKEYSFQIKREEVDNLALNSDIVYIQAGQIKNIICNGATASALSAAVYSLSEAGTEETAISGTFTYNGGKPLKIGDILCVYSGLQSPQEKTADQALYDDVAYVKVTDINVTTITYESAEAQDVLLLAKTVAIKKTDGLDLERADQKFFFKVDTLIAEHTWIMGDNSPTAGAIAVGDTIALYDADSLANAAPGDVTLGIVTGITGTSPYTISCEITSVEALQQRVEYYQNVPLNMEELVTSGAIDTGMLKRELRQQTLQSGIVDELAAQYALMALEGNLLQGSLENAEGLTVLMADGTLASADRLRGLMATSASDEKVTVGERDIKVSIKGGGENLGPGALEATIQVSFDVTIKTKEEDSIKLSFSVTFTQELFLSVEASGGIEYGWAFVVPYIEECWINASLSVKTYSGVELKATLTTVSGDSENTVDISEKIKTIINGKEESSALENVSGIYKNYQDFMENDLDYIQIVKKSLFKLNVSLAGGLVQITIEPHFVVNAAANAALTCKLEYREGIKYSFTARLSSQSLTFNKSTILDKQFDFSLYLVGSLGLRVGIELELKAGLISTKLNSMGIVAQAGLYLEWCGFMSYEYSRNFTQGTSYSVAKGAMYAEFGVYLEVGANFQVGNGKKQKNFGLVSETFPLLSTESKEYVYDFSYELDEEEVLLINKTVNSLPENAFTMIELDLQSGKSFLKKYPMDRFNIAFTDRAFYLDDDKKIQINTTADYVEADMIITWKSSPLAFTTMPIKRTFRIIFDNSETPRQKGLLTVAVNGTPVWSQRVYFEEDQEAVVPDKEKVLELIRYSNDDRTIAGVGPVNLRYLNEGGYENSPSGKVDGSKTFDYELPVRTYAVTVADIQNKEGNLSPQNFETVYGGAFDFSSLLGTGTEIYDKEYTKFTHVETRKGDIAEGLLLSGGVQEALATQLLQGNHTYHAAYVDNSAKVNYRFLTLVGAIQNKTEIVKKNAVPQFNYQDHVANADSLIYNIQGDVAAPVNGERNIFITCVPKDGYELILNRYDGDYVPGYKPPAKYNPTYGTELPTGGALTLDGYAFAGWYEDSDFSGNPVKVAQGNMGPKTYHAMWVLPEYTIQFDSNGGTGEMADMSARFGEFATVPVDSYELESFKTFGDTFLGWNTKADGSGIPYWTGQEFDIPEGIRADGVLTLYAQWDDHQVTYQPTNPDAPVPTGKMALSAALRYSEEYPGVITFLDDNSRIIKTIVLPDGVTLQGAGKTLIPEVNTLFEIREDRSVILKDLQIGGFAPSEYATSQIENKGNLTLENLYISLLLKEGYTLRNGEAGRVIIRNSTIWGDTGGYSHENSVVFNEGIMVIDDVEIGNHSAKFAPAITNQGRMVLNNLHYTENDGANFNEIYNDGGDLYILNSTLTGNQSSSAGIISEGGTLYLVNSLIGGNTDSGDSWAYNNIKVDSESEAYLYNSIYGAIEAESLGMLHPENSKHFSDEEIYRGYGITVLKDAALKAQAATIYLDYSNLSHIKIGYSFGGDIIHILNTATEASAIKKYQGGGPRDLEDNRVGAEYLEIQE